MIIVVNFIVGLIAIALVIAILYAIGLILCRITPDILNYNNDFFGIMLCGVLGCAIIGLCITLSILFYHVGAEIVNRLI
jgi:hypothetical protein